MAKIRTPSKPQNYPEKKIGPFAGGVGSRAGRVLGNGKKATP